MEPIQSFAQLTAHLKKLNHRKRIAVVCANDPNTEYAITRALEEGIAEFLMIGDSAILEKYPTLKQYPEYIKIIHIEDSDEAAREAVLDRMDEYGYLNDTRVAENLVNKLLHRQGKGRMLVERELRQRGISDTVIEEVLAGEDRDDEFLRARACAEDRARRLRGLDDVTAQRRLVSYLQRRGFTSGVAFRAAEDALNGNDRGIASGEPRRGVFFEPSDA